jgi:hypothetical protein
MPTKPVMDPDAEAFYVRHFVTLKDAAISQFHLPQDDAETLVHEILTASLCQKKRISNMTEWLSGALKAAVTAGVRGDHGR